MRAMFCGNNIVVNSSTGLSQLETVVDLCKNNSEPIIISDPPINEVYNAHNEWYPININILQKAMREAYDNKSANLVNKEIIELNHSYEAIGKIIEEILT
jgi:hypothetical protein